MKIAIITPVNHNIGDKFAQVTQYMRRYVQWKQYYFLNEIHNKIYNCFEGSLLRIFEIVDYKRLFNDS